MSVSLSLSRTLDMKTEDSFEDAIEDAIIASVHRCDDRILDGVLEQRPGLCGAVNQLERSFFLSNYNYNLQVRFQTKATQ